MSAARALARERGFTLIEVMVAVTLLMIGVLATVTMVDQASSTTNSTKAREAGTGLAREVLEAARAIPYPELARDTVVAKLQAQAGLEDALPATGWQIQRRGFDYAGDVDVCLIDVGPPSDPAGPHDTTYWTTGNPAPDTRDRNADDQKRVSVTLQWRGNPGAKTHSVVQTSVIANPAGALGPTVAALELTSTKVLSDPETIPTGSKATFRAVTSSEANAVTWSVDGQVDGSASEKAGSEGLEWNFDWSFDKSDGSCCRFYDGTYTIGAIASDSTGRTGTPKTLRVRLNRMEPLPPDGFEGGYNPVDPNPIVELVWRQNPERDVEGYRVFRVTAAGEEQVDSCNEPSRSYTTKLECYDSAPQFSASVAIYRIRALGRDNTGNPGNLREGASTELTVAKTGNNPPTRRATSTPARAGSLAASTRRKPRADRDDADLLGRLERPRWRLDPLLPRLPRRRSLHRPLREGLLDRRHELPVLRRQDGRPRAHLLGHGRRRAPRRVARPVLGGEQVSRLAHQRGFTLVEAVLVLLLMTIVLGGTLTAFESFTKTAHTNEKQNDSQQEARRALDMMARDLRNLSSPTDELPFALDVAKPDEIIFQSVHKKKDTPTNAYNTRRVRYCLDATAQQVIRQTQANPGQAVPPTTACQKNASSATWTAGVVVAEHVVNAARPIWQYNPPLSASSPDPTTVTSIRAELFVDVNPGKSPPEIELATGVQLRNQNRRPIADFTADSPQPGVVVLNASPSIDPEGRALRYAWYLGGSASGTPLNDQISYTCCSTPLSPGTHSFTLQVQDSQLSSTVTKEVVVK